MSTKQVVFDADLRRQLTTGIDPIANAVKVTLISGGVVWASRNPAEARSTSHTAEQYQQ